MAPHGCTSPRGPAGCPTARMTARDTGRSAADDCGPRAHGAAAATLAACLEPHDSDATPGAGGHHQTHRCGHADLAAFAALPNLQTRPALDAASCPASRLGADDHDWTTAAGANPCVAVPSHPRTTCTTAAAGDAGAALHQTWPPARSPRYRGRRARRPMHCAHWGRPRAQTPRIPRGPRGLA